MALKMKKVGKNSFVPTEIVPFIEGLERIVGKERIGYGKFLHTGPPKREIKMQYYDEQNKTLAVRVNCPEYTQVILLRVDVPQIKAVQDFVKSYPF